MKLFWTIFEREYFNIVKKKAFWLTTLLLPVGMAAIIGIQVAAMALGGTEETTLWIPSTDNPLKPYLKDGSTTHFRYSDLPVDSLQAKAEKNSAEVVLILPDSFLLNKQSISFTIYHGAGNLSESALNHIEKNIYKAVYDYKRDKLGLQQAQLDQLKFTVAATTQRITKEGKQQSSTTMAYGLGFVMNLLMYLLVVMYGSMMMQSVIEEKNNRIVEIILSSVEPFRLLMGKIFAVALAGLTQFVLWILLTGIVITIAGVITGIAVSPTDLPATAPQGVDSAETERIVNELMIGAQNFNWNILYFFPIYFLGGFLLVGSLYAALGSAVDNVQDGQQYSLPLTFLSMLPMLFITYVLQNPNSPFSVFCSIFPFFSPMVMMARMALTEVPAYQIVISIMVLIGSFFLSVWVSAKIYRVGILMYGKKASFRELIKWLRY